jgi:hypothetical protein
VNLQSQREGFRGSKQHRSPKIRLMRSIACLWEDFSAQDVEGGQGVSNCTLLVCGTETRVDLSKATVYGGLCRFDAPRKF